MNSNPPCMNFGRKFLLLAILVLPAGMASARPLEQYIADIDKSWKELRPFADGSVDLTDKDAEQAAIEVLAKIQNRIPERDEIEFKGESVPVENGWIKRAVSTFRSETEPSRKRIVLRSLVDRLNAIYLQTSRIPALERRVTSKDDEKRRLNEILSREEYAVARADDESPASRFLSYIKEWIGSLFPDSQPVANQKGADLRYLQNGLQVFIYLLSLALVVYLILRFGPHVVRRYMRQKTIGQKRVILGEEIAADATPGDLFSEAETLALTGDIRGAIRKGYISLLFELGQRRLIGLAKHKTNRDYLGDLKKDKRLRLKVGNLTRSYEGIWYGNRRVEDEEWADFSASYRDTLG